MKQRAFLVTLALAVAAPGATLAQARFRADTKAVGASDDALRVHAWSHVRESATPTSAMQVDSSATGHRRATLFAGIVGGVAGGLAAAAYVLNATAYDCVTIGPPCPHDRHTTRRVLTITAGTVGGGALGAWIGHTVANRRAH
jgi:hypothetical protein